MDNWKLIAIAVTVFAFSLELRPMESFLTAYLTGPDVNVTLNEVTLELTPIRIYTGVVGTFVVFLMSDYLRYKPVMIINGLLGVLAYICLIGSPSILRLKLAEMFMSLFTCAEVSYYGYLYARIKDKEYYQRATGFAKAGMLSGTCVSGLLAQLVVKLNDNDYSSLPYYSLAGVTFATVWVCFLPSVNYSNYFHLEDSVAKTDAFSKAVIHDPNLPKYSTGEADSKKVNQRTVMAISPIKHIYEDFKHSFKNHNILIWSFWYTIAMSGYMQVILYMNVLYTYDTNVSNNKKMMFNGLVDSLSTLCAAFCSYYTGKLNVDWTRHRGTFLALSSLILGLALCLCSYLKNLTFVYILYILYVTLVQSSFVIAISQIGKNLRNDSYTLVLGFDAFLAIGLSTISSVVLNCNEISVPGRFLMYGGIYVVLGITYGNVACFKKSSTAIF